MAFIVLVMHQQLHMFAAQFHLLGLHGGLGLHGVVHVVDNSHGCILAFAQHRVATQCVLLVPLQKQQLSHYHKIVVKAHLATQTLINALLALHVFLDILSHQLVCLHTTPCVLILHHLL